MHVSVDEVRTTNTPVESNSAVKHDITVSLNHQYNNSTGCCNQIFIVDLRVHSVMKLNILVHYQYFKFLFEEK
jgi:hypothetical protein